MCCVCLSALAYVVSLVRQKTHKSNANVVCMAKVFVPYSSFYRMYVNECVCVHERYAFACAR